MTRPPLPRLPGAPALLAALAICACGRQTPPPQPEPTPAPSAAAPREVPDEALRHLNRGVGFLEQHRFGQAQEELRQALALEPGLVEARIDLAIALDADVKYPEALAELERALAAAPASPTALYVTGLIHKKLGDKEKALAAFRRVHELDTADTDTKYHLASLYKDLGELDRAIPLLEEVTRASPYFASAWYALGQALLRLGQERSDPAATARGEAAIEQFQRLSGGTSAETAGLRYGEQGRYSMAVEPPLRPDLPPPAFRWEAEDRGVAFRHSAAGAQELGGGALVGDLDGDGDEDVLLAGASGGGARLFRNDGTGRFEDATAAAGLSGLARPALGVSAGDVDNDGVTDLVIAGRLLRGTGDGRFADETARSGLGPDRLAGAGSVTLVDLDHDGDLDLLAAFPAGGGLRAWQNDGRGLFAPLAATGMEGDYRAMSLVATDHDLDRDVDIVVGVDGGPIRLYSNNRDLTFTDVAAAAGLAGAGPVRGLAAGDLDGDEAEDLVVAGATGSSHVVYRNRGDRTFERSAELPSAGGPAGGAELLDADLDGDLDLLVAEPAGLRLWRNDGTGRLSEATGEVLGAGAAAGGRGLASGDLDGDGDLDLVVNVAGGQAVTLASRGLEGRGWIRIVPRGLNSNRSGFGTKVAVRAGAVRQKVETRGAAGFLSQSARGAHFGLGDARRVDRVRLLWPGGVLQAELDLEPGRTHVVEELDRKGSSCPFLWGWDGSAVSFLSDIQGGSPLGLWVAPGVRNLPDPDEWYLLPDRVRPRDGAFDLRITESLEEVCYVDRVMLRAVDVPAGVRVFPDERLLLAPPFASGGLHLVTETRPPVAARDGDGRDVRESLAATDRRYAGAGRGSGFRGIAEPWSLELDFGRLRPEDRGRRLVLLAHGWVEFSNSTPMYAASQAGVRIELPAVDVLDEHGRVIATRADAGAPAGLPKWMALDLTEELAGAGVARIVYRTSLEVHLDQVLLGISDPALPHRTADVEASEATLVRVGYPEAWSPDGERPVLYRYDRLLPDETWGNQEGLYTRLGDVRELLLREDDRHVVMVHGDEVRLRFPEARLPPVPPGQVRHLLLYSVGYAKDMDPRSAAPHTVGPLPYRAMRSYPYPGPGPLADPGYAAELARWNTRYVRPSATALR